MPELASDSLAFARAAKNFAVNNETDADSGSRANQNKIFQRALVCFLKPQSGFVNGGCRRVVFDHNFDFAVRRIFKFKFFERVGNGDIAPIEMRSIKQLAARTVNYSRNADADDF